MAKTKLINHAEMVERLREVVEEEETLRAAAIRLGYPKTYAAYLGRILTGKDSVPARLGKRLGAIERIIMFEVPDTEEKRERKK